MRYCNSACIIYYHLSVLFFYSQDISQMYLLFYSSCTLKALVWIMSYWNTDEGFLGEEGCGVWQTVHSASLTLYADVQERVAIEVCVVFMVLRHW